MPRIVEVECQKASCEWPKFEAKDTRQARREAYTHVIHTGHEVQVTITDVEWISKESISG